MLKSKHFFNRDELTSFINANNLKKEDIQAILVVEDKHLLLFYWESPTING